VPIIICTYLFYGEIFADDHGNGFLVGYHTPQTWSKSNSQHLSVCNQLNKTHTHIYAQYQHSGEHGCYDLYRNWTAASICAITNIIIILLYDHQNENKKQNNKTKISSYRALPTTRTTVLALPPANGVQNTPCHSDTPPIPSDHNPRYWALVAPWSPKRDLRGNAWRGQHVNDGAAPGDLLRLYSRATRTPKPQGGRSSCRTCNPSTLRLNPPLYRYLSFCSFILLFKCVSL